MSETKYKPFVPANVKMSEFTFGAVAVGLVLSVVLGAANAYLGLRAGITIAATYPAAVIGMAVVRLWKGSILEENLARTAGSIGESIAAGAIFTLPAFVLSKSWLDFGTPEAYYKSTALMVVGGVLGVLFVSLIRRTMVEDAELPFPESVAAAEIHKAGQSAGNAAKYLFYNMAIGGVTYLLGVFKAFEPDHDFFIRLGELGKSALRLGPAGSPNTIATGAVTKAAAPSVSPAYIGVGYIIGLRLASIQFAGGFLAWGLMVPVLMYFLGPRISDFLPANATDANWDGQANAVWRYIVRPIAVGGMMVGAAYTLFKMRKNLFAGIGRAVKELTGPPVDPSTLERHERYMSSKVVFGLIGVAFLAMIVLYSYLAGGALAGTIAAVVMIVAGFFFCIASGSLVGMIGSSNNPISGLTLSTLIIAALLMLSLGVSGASGIIAVLGVASVVCVAAATAGELLQDFKVGYILGGTPRTIQIVELISVIVSSLVMYFPLLVLHQGNINAGGIGFGDPKLPAPQAGLMAALAQGIVGGEMAWPLVAMGALMGVAMIMLQVRSPMLVAVGMYLPIATTFAIFVGGVIRWFADAAAERRGFNHAQKARVENTGILVASGLIAGEGLMGLVVASISFLNKPMPVIFANPSYAIGVLVILGLAALLIRLPLGAAGRPEDPAPPTAMV